MRYRFPLDTIPITQVNPLFKIIPGGHLRLAVHIVGVIALRILTPTDLNPEPDHTVISTDHIYDKIPGITRIDPRNLQV